MSLVVTAVSSGKVIDEVTLEDGKLTYATGNAKPVFETFLKRSKEFNAERAYALLSGFTNGYFAVSESDGTQTAAIEINGNQTAAEIDKHGNWHSDRDGRFIKKGSGAGRRLTNVAKALESGEPDALAPFNREQLQREVRRLNREGADIKLRRGASEDEIKDALRAHAGGGELARKKEAAQFAEKLSQLNRSESETVALMEGKSAADLRRIAEELGVRYPRAMGLDREGLAKHIARSLHAFGTGMESSADRRRQNREAEERFKAEKGELTPEQAAEQHHERLRERQRKIDSQRERASLLAEIDEIVDKQAEPRVMEHRIRALMNRGGLADDPNMRPLLDADMADYPKLQELVGKIAEDLGFKRLGGEIVANVEGPFGPSDIERGRFRRGVHTPMGGSIREGQVVDIVRPGYVSNVDGEEVTLFPAVVTPSTNDPVLSERPFRRGQIEPDARDRQAREAMAQVEAISNAIKNAPGSDRTPEEGARERTQAALDGLKKAQLADVARELGVPFQSKATKPQIIRAIVQTKIEGLINTRSIMRTDVSGGFTPGRIAASNIRAIQEAIRGSGPSDRSGETGARERAREALKGFPKPALIEAAGELGVPISSRASAAQIIETIVDIAIGSLLLTRSIERPSQTAGAGHDDGLVLDAAFSAALEAAMELGEDVTEEEFAAEFMAEFASRMPEHLQRYWTEGAGAARVRWFVRGAFRRCRRVLRTEGVPGRMLDGTCANLYHRATGRWPGAHKTQTAAVEVEDEFAALTAVELSELVDILTEEMNMGEDHGTQTACGCGGGASVAEPPPEMAADDGYVSIWEGPLAPMSTPTGDAEPRMFAPGALSGRGLPRALRWQPQQERGHDGAVVVGALTHYWLDDRGTPWGRAYFFDEKVIPEAAKARYLAEHGVVAPSVDLEPSMEVVFTDEQGNQFNPMTCAADGSCPARTRSMITRGTIASATLVPIAAFGELGSGRLYRGPQPTVDSYRSATQIAAVRFGGWDDMPIADESRPWDKEAAEQRIAEWATEGDKVDWERYGQAFLWRDTPADSKGSFKFPVADVIEDELVIIPRAVFAAAARVGQANISAEDQDAIREALSDIYDQAAEELGNDDLIAPWDDDREEMSVKGCGCAAKIGALVPDGTQTAAASCDSCGSKYGVFGNLEPYPADAFAPVKFDQLTPVHIEQRPGEPFARVLGHVGDWKGCHRSFKHVCVPPPKSRTNYAEFHTAGHVRTPDGLLRVGKVVMGEGHPDSSVPARVARAYYDATSKEIAHVRGYEDQFGPYINGVLAPGVTPEEATTFLASPVSGDWKNHEMIAVLAVNVGGHPIRTSATFDANGVPRNVVAAGRFWPDEDDADVTEAAAVLWEAEHRHLLEVIG